MDKLNVPDELKNRPRKWLITGGAGFIGSHIVARLISLGQSVVVLDNLSSGYERNLPLEKITFLHGDIRDQDICEKACKDVDIVLHHAAIGSVVKSIADPVLVDAVNVGGTLRVLMASIAAGAKRFVFASSSAVYGDSGTTPCVEDQTLYPKSPYAVTKRACEYYSTILGQHHGICTTGLRYFNVYGPRQDPQGAYAAVIPKWTQSLLKDEPVEIYGDGKTVRDFCFIDDVVNANLQAALADETLVNGQSYNIASGSPTTLNELHRILSTATGHGETKPTYNGFRAGDIHFSCASIDKAREGFGFAPSISLSEGIRKTIGWYRSGDML